MSIQYRLEKQCVPVIVKRHGTASDLVFVDWESNKTPAGDKQFASSVVFLSAVFKNKTGVIQFPLVVKCQLPNAKFRHLCKLEEQFHNEILAYENILPFINTNNVIEDLFPSYYCGHSSDTKPEDDFIVLQDLRPDGFRLTDEIIFLDYDHCALAMKQIGRYHALSYNAKQNKTEEFYSIIKGLQECRFKEDMAEINYYLFTISCKRAVKPFLDRNEHADVINRFMEKIEEANNYLSELVRPEEPLAVLCHGDFCRNNILFRYDSDKPIDAKLFDIATARYASPAVDLSFFLFLNTSYELRRLYWDEFLTIYHDAMVETLPDVVMPSLDDIKQEMLKKSVYGFVICCTFLPFLLSAEPWNWEDFCDLPAEERYKLNETIGGQEGTDLIANMFKELIERGCIM